MRPSGRRCSLDGTVSLGLPRSLRCRPTGNRESRRQRRPRASARRTMACIAAGGTPKHHTRKPLPLAVLTGCSGRAEPVREPCSPFRQPGDLLAKAHGFASRPCDRFALIEDGRRRPMCGARSKVQTTDEGTSAKSGDESDPPGLPESRSRPGGSRRRIAFCTQQA